MKLSTNLKRFLWITFISLICGGMWFGYQVWKNKQWQKAQAKEHELFMANIKDTASPNVFVLRDSIPVAYRNEKKTIHVYLPPNYAQDSLKRYPVMYFMDGESSFNDMENEAPEWQIDEVIDSMAKAGQQAAIVIGISQADDRDAEYTPFINKDNPEAHGKQYGEWLANDLKSWVDANFRTETKASSTTIGGISRSGMMAYYLMMAHPDVFGNAIIQSPAMWVDHDRLLDMPISQAALSDKKVFVSVGEWEGRIMVPHAEDIYEKFKNMGLGDDQLRFEIIPNESHTHYTWRKSFALAYPWLMRQ